MHEVWVYVRYLLHFLISDALRAVSKRDPIEAVHDA